jgi:hypothetical protein
MKRNPDIKSGENGQASGYPDYPSNEDIYNKEKAEPYSETEDSALNLGLDVPGAELDDADEMIGAEDEENNYYSLGDDFDIDLDELNSEK